MKILQCRNIVLNNQEAKICVPITGKTDNDVIAQVKSIKKINPDIVEWRADFYQVEEPEKDMVYMLEKIHDILGDTPIIFTFRTAREGGERDVDFETYKSYCLEIAKDAEKNNVAFIDVEACGMQNEKGFNEFIGSIHEWNVKIIGSNHHFDKTPSKEQMVNILTDMEKMGADVCKLAVMPREKEDVDALIGASVFADKKLHVPIITMSMGELGAVTRVCTRLTGSVITFAAGTNASAPGQIECDIVKKLLKAGIGCEMNGNIALIGFMGTGKTTISKALSRITGFNEIDVDRYIVEKAGMEISDIFEKYGETYFRDLETQALQEIQKGSNQIISCGGGAVLRDENVEILKNGGVIVLLTATPETIFERVKDHTHRPILNNDMSLEHVKRLMDNREPRYQSVADIKVNVDRNDRVLTCYDILTELEKREYIKFKGMDI